MTNPFASESQRYEYDLNHGDVVIDAGGYEGAFAFEIIRRYGCRVVVLEPIKAFFENCLTGLSGNPLAGVRNVGLGAFTGPIEMGVSNNSSGLYSSGETKETVTLETLKRVMKTAGIDKVSLLKLNIEGAEYGVLEKAIQDGLMSKVQHLQVQWHFNAPRAEDRYHAIRRTLLETHDHVWGEDPSLWQSYSLKA